MCGLKPAPTCFTVSDKTLIHVGPGFSPDMKQLSDGSHSTLPWPIFSKHFIRQ